MVNKREIHQFSEEERQGIIHANSQFLIQENHRASDFLWFNTPIRGEIDDIEMMISNGILGSSARANLSKMPLLGTGRPYTVCIIPPDFENTLLAVQGEFRGDTSVGLRVAALPISSINVNTNAIDRFLEIAEVRSSRYLRILPPECVIGGIMLENGNHRHIAKPIALNPIYLPVLTPERLIDIVTPRVYIGGGHQ